MNITLEESTGELGALRNERCPSVDRSIVALGARKSLKPPDLQKSIVLDVSGANAFALVLLSQQTLLAGTVQRDAVPEPDKESAPAFAVHPLHFWQRLHIMQDYVGKLRGFFLLRMLAVDTLLDNRLLNTQLQAEGSSR